MAVDIRATVTCSLGTLISGSLSDDYLQGAGLIKTRGSAEISGTIVPAPGTVVTFSYTKGGVTRNIPRKLRVLSSFADPYRRTSTVELGCKLTYLADLKDPIDWSVFDDPDNSEFTEDDSKVVTLPISASSVMTKCLTELGITASASPLTNHFSVGEFDFSAGYVNILSDLLVSESYFGYLDFNEVLQIVDLKTDYSGGPVYTANEIIDLGPINSGQLPGEAVVVSYNTMRLKDPEVPKVPDPEDDDFDEATERLERINWERSTSINGPVSATIGPRTYTWMETTDTLTTYTVVNGQSVPAVRTTITTGSTAKVAGAIGTSYARFGILFNAENVVLTRIVETFQYDTNGNVTRNENVTFTNATAFFGKLSVEYAFSGTDFVNFPSSGSLLPTQRVVTEYQRVGDVQQQIATQYVSWSDTLTGQQAVAEYRVTGELSTSAGVVEYLNRVIAAGLVYADTQVSINQVGRTPGRPGGVLNATQSRDGDPFKNYRLENKADLELALGSPTAQRRIEFALPYAPDDYFVQGAGLFLRVQSDAPTKARNFGRVQNRLLLGNRNGMNLQLAPERLPAAPFAPMYVQANGLTAQYRANGNQWAFDSNGIACSTDALFWAAVGGTGTFWFPVAPGITTLPATPAPVNGVLTPTTLTLPYNETVKVKATLRLSLKVSRFSYALERFTEIPPISMRLQANVRVVELSDDLDEFFSSVTALLRMNGDDESTTFVDSSELERTVTAFGDAKITTTVSKFDGASAEFDGVDSYLEIEATATALESEDFTAECWFRTRQNTDWTPIFHLYPSYDSHQLFVSEGDLFYMVQGESAILGPGITNDEWHYCAVVRTNGFVTLFFNGDLIGEPLEEYIDPVDTDWLFDPFPIDIGRDESRGYLDGFVDEFRFTQEGVARYAVGTGANAGKMVFAGTNTLALPTKRFPGIGPDS
jgi:hypothetical protein